MNRSVREPTVERGYVADTGVGTFHTHVVVGGNDTFLKILGSVAECSCGLLVGIRQFQLVFARSERAKAQQKG